MNDAGSVSRAGDASEGAAVQTTTIDRVGYVLLAGWLLWTVITATINHRQQSLMTPYFTSPLFIVFGALLGRRLARIGVDLRAALLMFFVVAYLLWAVVFVGGPEGGPLGYSNATAALAAQLVALAGLLALDTRGSTRWLLLGVAVLAVLVVLITRSDAGTIIVVPLVAATALAMTGKVSRKWWSTTLGVVGVVGAGAAVVGLTIAQQWPQRVVNALSATRHGLWQDALTLWAQHPLIGSGPGAFRRFSKHATISTHETAHMSLLQIGAETGLMGALLFAAVITLGFVMATRGRPAATLIVSAALSALLIHSFVDHLLEFWPVMLVVGISLGHVTSARAPHTTAPDST